MASDAIVYDVYQAKPKAGLALDVFKSVVAGTEELGGLEKRSGGAVQYLVPDRGSWEFEIQTGRRINNVGR